MFQMLRSKVKLGVLAVLFALLFAGIGAGIAVAAQNHMINARNYLNSALSELEASESNKGGHRVNAINYVKNAISEVNAGIEYAR
jgi:lipopolysaccharide export LptBFGC system permease protein LptF